MARLTLDRFCSFLLCISIVFVSINSSVFGENINGQKKIVIIGAGASGLCAARHAISQGFDVTIFEQTDHVGGTWAYTDHTGNDDYGLPSLGTVYKDLLTNAPIETMGYPDYEFKNIGRSHVSHVEVLKFLESYAKHFNLTSVTKFGHYVVRVAPTEGDRWEVVVRNLKYNSYDVVNSDFVFVCNGLHHVPNLPAIPGMDQFKGAQLHSRDYRTPERFENESVLMIGSGPSGVDITRIVATTAEKVIFSTHDHTKLIFPANVQMKPDVAKIKPNSVVFADGTEENITTIIYCTGYKYSYPFLSIDSGVSLKSTEHVYPLYKHIVNINKPTIAFIGLQLLSFTNLIFDLQVRFALSVWSGKTTLPTKEDMLEDTEKFVKKQWDAGFKKRQGHCLAFETENYYREVAKIGGIEGLPDVYFKLFDIVLEKLITEPNTFRQYNYKIIDNSTYEMTNDEIYSV